jgi:hypothetical protein
MKKLDKGTIASELIIEATEMKGKRPTQLNFEELIDVVESVVKKLSIHGVTTRTFRFSGLYNKDKFTKLITAPNRETAIAYFETENPHLTWRTSTELD